VRTILFGLVFLLSATSAMAKPNVSGNTITWPDDGWYQVQDADTYRSVCGGGSSCSVEPGNYIVINHTTGERFENIQVGQTQRPVTVSGNTISWPDDGWYQVQRADTYESICEGGTSCQVANGNYIVINHTSGKRYSGINVATVTKPKPAPKPEPKPNPVATGPLGCTAPESQIRQRALELINAARAESRMCGTVSYAAAPPVTWNSKLAQAARKHSNDMASNNFFSHTGSDLITCRGDHRGTTPRAHFRASVSNQNTRLRQRKWCRQRDSILNTRFQYLLPEQLPGFNQSSLIFRVIV